MTPTEHLCPRCTRPAGTQTLCPACLDALHADLDALPDLIDQLHTQLARMGRLGHAVGGRSAERPSPVDWRASEVLDLLRSVLVGWVRDVTPEPSAQPADTLQAMTAHLRFTDWRRHPAADEFADEIGYAIAEGRRAIDAPPERRYLGECMEPIEGRGDCPGDVWQVGAKRTAACALCGHPHDVARRQEWIADIAQDRLVTASEAAGALSAWGTSITGDLVRHWAARGRLVAHGADLHGRPVYRFGECRALALIAVSRRGA